MNIIQTQYTLKRKSLEIYKSGCRGPHCKGCHNPETWEFNQGIPWREYKQRVFDKVKYKIILGLTATLERLDGKHKLLEEKGYNPLAYRLMVVNSHYRKTLLFSYDIFLSNKNPLIFLHKSLKFFR